MSQNRKSLASLDDAITGNYHFEIGETLTEAWQRTYGCKWTFQVACFYYFLVAAATLIVMYVCSLALGYSDTSIEQNPAIKLSAGYWIYSIVSQISWIFITTPLAVGLAMMGIGRSIDKPLSPSMVFDTYIKTLPIFLTAVLMYTMISLGFILLIIPGIYLSVAYMFALPLIADKNLGTWEAMEISRKSVSKRWFSLLCFEISLGIILMISSLPLGIGLIWTMPMAVIANGIAYRNIFDSGNLANI